MLMLFYDIEDYDIFHQTETGEDRAQKARGIVPLFDGWISPWVPGEGVTGHHVPENVEDREGKGEAGHLDHRPLLL
jgi:hypothetical protein